MRDIYYIVNGLEMSTIFFLLSEDRSKIEFLWNVNKTNKITEEILMDRFIPHVDMTHIFGGIIIWPINKKIVVIKMEVVELGPERKISSEKWKRERKFLVNSFVAMNSTLYSPCYELVCHCLPHWIHNLVFMIRYPYKEKRFSTWI